MKCPHTPCKGSIIQKSDSGGLKLRIKGQVTVDDSGLHAQCYWCGEEVTLPLELKKSAPIAFERFLIAPKK